MSVNMPMAMAQAVFQEVRKGTYASAGAVVRAALREMLKLDGDDDSPDEPETPPPPLASDDARDGPRWRARRPTK